MEFQSILQGFHFGPAYLDGGTGSMLIQAAIAGFVTAGYVLKTRWLQLKASFAKRRNPDQNV